MKKLLEIKSKIEKISSGDKTIVFDILKSNWSMYGLEGWLKGLEDDDKIFSFRIYKSNENKVYVNFHKEKDFDYVSDIASRYIDHTETNKLNN